jgi:hypothetical protein
LSAFENKTFDDFKKNNLLIFILYEILGQAQALSSSKSGTHFSLLLLCGGLLSMLCCLGLEQG